MKGQHKPGYRRPRTGEKRAQRKPFAIDKLPSSWRDRIIACRAKWIPFEQIEQESTTWEWEKLPQVLVLAYFPSRRIPSSTLHRWYDVRVEQMMREERKYSAFSEQLAASFNEKTYGDLAEITKKAIASEVYSAAIQGGSPGNRLKAQGDFLFLLTKLINAKAREKSVELQQQKQKLVELKEKADKATNDAAGKIGKGRALTVDDIDRIRERTFGLPPVQRNAAAGTPA